MTDLEACEWAANALKAIGFQLWYASMKTEACYYSWPGKNGVLRVAAHSGGDGFNKTTPIMARVTFCYSSSEERKINCLRLGEKKMHEMLAIAIGQYFLRSASVIPRQKRDRRAGLRATQSIPLKVNLRQP